MTVTVYKSTDASAPVLTGLAGSLVTVLDAVLVNGYGVKPAAGWTIPFTGVNKRAYRGATGALRPYIRVQDDAPRAAPYNNGTEARISAAESQSAIDTQTGRFPAGTATMVLRKSRTPDATARPWVIVADDRTCYIFVMSGDYGNGYASAAFGEYYSVKSTTDSYNGLIIGSVTEQINTSPTPFAGNENLPKLGGVTATVAGHFTPRSVLEDGPATASIAVGKHGNAAHSATNLVGLLQYPNLSDGGLYLSQVWLHEPATLGIIRGRLRGFWHILHPASTLKDGDTWNGTGQLAGKTFLAIGPVPDGLGTFVMETSSTWETN